MTSVPSHRRRLSGSRGWLYGLLLILSISACGTTESLPRRPSTRPTTPVVTKPKVKVDTVSWTEVDETTDPASDEDIAVVAGKKERYDISVLIPLEVSAKGSMADSDDRFVNYYGGMLMAVDILNNQGKQYDIHVHDVGSRSQSIADRVPTMVDHADVIIAPFHREHVEAVAAYGLDHKIPVISPWLVSSKVADGNPYYIKLMPDLRDYYQVIMEDIAARYDKEQVVIIGNDTDRSKVKYLQELAKALYRTGEEDAVQEYLVEADSLANGVTAFDTTFFRAKEKVFVIPNYSTSDESFVYGCVRRLAVEKGATQLTVYGMPLVLDSDRMEYDYFKALNMKVARSKFVDRFDQRVISFKTDYYARYGALPTDDAYEGYDMMMYIGDKLWQHGVDFRSHLSEQSDPYLQSSFAVEAKLAKSSTGDDATDEVDYFVNRHIDIITFAEGRFRR